MFGHATFMHDAWFGFATFTQAANFRSAKFRQDAHFISATFARDAQFDSAIFTQAAIFMSAKCTRDANFMSATFTQGARFQFATFTQDAWFVSAIFAQGAQCISAIFSGFAYFSRARFKFGPCFIDSQFEKPTKFNFAAFGKSFPVLDGAVLHPNTSFTARESAEVGNDDRQSDTKEVRRLWPDKIVGSQEELEAAKDSCSIIRHAVGQQGRPEDEHFFFRKEMGFAAQIGGWWQRLPYRLFGWISYFGYSIARPSLALGGTVRIPAGFYIVYHACQNVLNGEISNVPQWFGFSFSNTFSFLGFRGLYFGSDFVAALPWWMNVIGAVQTVLGFVFLFFLALGLRTRFRLR